MTIPNADDEDFDPDELPQQPHVRYTNLPSNQPNNGSINKPNNQQLNEPVTMMQMDRNGEEKSRSVGDLDVNRDDPDLQGQSRYINEFDLRQQISAIQTELDDIQQQIDLSERGNLPSNILQQSDKNSNQKKSQLKKPKQRPQSAKASVRINENENVTFDLGGSGSRSQRYRPGSGRRDLRHVKSRIDSGVKMYPARPPGMEFTF